MDYRILAERMRHGVKRRTPLSEEVRRVLSALVVTLSLLFLSASILYLFQTGKSAGQGFLLRQTEMENQNQKTLNRDLKQKVLQSQSLESILKSRSLKNMEQATNPIYLPPDKVTLRSVQ